MDDSAAKDRPSKANVLAPHDGAVLTLPVTERQMVFPPGENNGTTLMTIGDLSKLVAQAHVKESDVGNLAARQTVQVTADSIQDEQIEATISFIARIATLQNSVKGFNVQVLIENPSRRLKPGMSVVLTIPTSTRGPK